MVYHKLEEAIKNALKDSNYGNNCVVVKTTHLGEVIVEEHDESSLVAEISSLKEKVDSLEEEVNLLEKENDELAEKIEELEEE